MSYLPGTTGHVKSSTRTSRPVLQASIRHKLMRSNPQPAQSVVLSVTENKNQTIITICEQLWEKMKTHETTTKHRLLVTGPAAIPVKIVKGIVMERRYLETIHNEVDVIIPQQIVNAAGQGAK